MGQETASLAYDEWPSGEPYRWDHAARTDNPWDNLDFHVDLGCGTLKKGRIGIDRFAAPGVNIVMDLDTLAVYAIASSPGENAVASIWHGGEATWEGQAGVESRDRMEATVIARGLPFPSDSVKSIITHHCLEHVGDGYIRLIDECYRVLEPGAIMRVIVPLFPSHAAMQDPDHKRFFVEGHFEYFMGTPDHIWTDAFSVPYAKARFEIVDKQLSPMKPPEEQWTQSDAREIRVALRAVK